jgi:hypothetical protein
LATATQNTGTGVTLALTDGLALDVAAGRAWC